METYDTRELVAVWACVGCRLRFAPISVAPDNGSPQSLDEALRSTVPMTGLDRPAPPAGQGPVDRLVWRPAPKRKYACSRGLR